MTMEVEIISVETVKPSSPTPLLLKTYKLSSMDQAFHHFYVPLTVFYKSDDSLRDTMTIKINLLKYTLSKTLSLFYPFAGRVKDNLHIDCNDEGVYYAVARVNIHLSDLLSRPSDPEIGLLVPEEPKDSSSGKYVLMIQVNVFGCGGMAITTCISHKLIDGISYMTFFKAWAAATKQSSPQILLPHFTAPLVFPQNSSLKQMWPINVATQANLQTKRFVFSASSLAALKAKATSPFSTPTRVVAVSSLVWKTTAKAAFEVRHSHDSNPPPHVLILVVNIRAKLSPPLPAESIGNLIWSTVACCVPQAKPDLSPTVDCVKKAISEVSGDLVEGVRGEKGYLKLGECLKMACDLVSTAGSDDRMLLTSFCNFGLYQVDFGWGKPEWFYYSNPGFPGFVVLVDTKDGDGIEAIVTLNEEDMGVFEHDPEILEYSAVDPSPLQTHVAAVSV